MKFGAPNFPAIIPHARIDSGGSDNCNKEWPWTELRSDFPKYQADGTVWPKVSIITPSYNQASFLEETVRSVLLQGYPNLEYIVIDGGSTDGSIEILQRYSPYLYYWHSRKDSGQANAINQGLQMATGDIVAWLNSDDTYLPGMFQKMIPLFKDLDVNCVYGKAYFSNEDSQIFEDYPAKPIAHGWKRMCYWRGWPIPQPTVLFRRDLLERYGYLDESLHFGLDYELFIRFTQHVPFHFVNEYLATYRVHKSAKTGDWSQNKSNFFREDLRVNLRYAPPSQINNWPLWMCWIIFLSKCHAKQILNPIFHRW